MSVSISVVLFLTMQFLSLFMSLLCRVCVLDVQEYLKLWMRANPNLVSALGDMSERGPFMAERPEID